MLSRLASMHCLRAPPPRHRFKVAQPLLLATKCQTSCELPSTSIDIHLHGAVCCGSQCFVSDCLLTLLQALRHQCYRVWRIAGLPRSQAFGAQALHLQPLARSK